MQKYRIITYGCQMNVHESEKIAGILTKLGYIEAKEGEDADVVVFNTCCIRDNAERKATGHIGMMKTEKKKNPDMVVAVVGCMTQQDGAGKALKEKFPFIDIVLGTSNLSLLETYIPSVAASRAKYVDIDENELPPINENESFYRTSGTNAWLNIMYGCNNFCTYCIVPYVRGRERSRTKEAIIDEFKRLVDEGYKEITLLKAKQKDAEVLQDKINRLLDEKKPLDGDRNVAERSKVQADKALDANTQTIHQLQERKVTAEQTSATLASDLSSLLMNLIPDWQQNTILAKEKIMFASNEYRDKRKELDVATQSLQTKQATTTAIGNIRNRILGLHADWDMPAVPETYV